MAKEKNLSLLPLIECNFLYSMKSMLYKYTIKIRQIATIQSHDFIYLSNLIDSSQNTTSNKIMKLKQSIQLHIKWHHIVVFCPSIYIMCTNYSMMPFTQLDLVSFGNKNRI